MNARAYFQSLSTTIIIINVIIGLSAIFLVERIVPAIDEILEENAYSVSAAVGMLSAVSSKNFSEYNANYENEFWEQFKKAKANITLPDEGKIISDIETAAKNYWVVSPPEGIRKVLTTKIDELAQINLQAMEKKDQAAQFMGLTGAWAIGLLLLISLGIQLLLRTKIISSLIRPVEDLLSVLSDFNSGNRMRRFVDNKLVVDDIRKIGSLINNNLDDATIKESRH